jgi:replicative DNA helicase
VVFFSLEMGKEQLMYRVLSNETEIPNTNLKTGNISKEEWIKLSRAIKKFSSLPIFIDDTTNISIQTIRVQLKKILFEQTKIGLVIIDYLQLMQNSKSKIENRVQELSQITRSLKNIAREFNIPVIALSQLSRNVETRINKRPLLSDLRESGSIEQDADLVLMLFRENYYNLKKEQEDLAEIIVAKHRNGPIGTIQLKFNAEFIKFSNYNY